MTDQRNMDTYLSQYNATRTTLTSILLNKTVNDCKCMLVSCNFTTKMLKAELEAHQRFVLSKSYSYMWIGAAHSAELGLNGSSSHNKTFVWKQN